MSSMNELVEAIKKAYDSWKEIAQQEEDEGYDDAILSIERGEAEGYYWGLRSAYIIINGHEPEGMEDDE
jgi:hypothetical protein